MASVVRFGEVAIDLDRVYAVERTCGGGGPDVVLGLRFFLDTESPGTGRPTLTVTNQDDGVSCNRVCELLRQRAPHLSPLGNLSLDLRTVAWARFTKGSEVVAVKVGDWPVAELSLDGEAAELLRGHFEDALDPHVR